MFLLDDVSEDNPSFEEFMNPPAGARSKYQDPRDMEREIRAEADRLLEELRTGIAMRSHLDERRPIPAGGDGENAIYFYKKRVMRKGGKREEYAHIRFEALVGSPLYIALYLKRYGEVAELLEKAPYSAMPGYAAMPVTVHYRNVSGEQLVKTDGMTGTDGLCESPDSGYLPEVTFHPDQAVYLQDMVLLDTNIPDELFVSLCRRLEERKESGVIDLPCRYEGRIGEPEITLKAEDPDDPAFTHWGYANRSCKVPSLLREFADWTDLKRHFGALEHVDKKWGDRMHSAEESRPYQESALFDEALFWKMMEGLERLKKLDEGLFHIWVDERTAAHFLVKYMFIIFHIVQSHFAVDGKQQTMPQRLKEMKEPIDVCARAAMLKTKLSRLGYDEVSADVLWNAFTDLGFRAAPVCNGFWIGLELWKLVFRKNLVFEVMEDAEPLGSNEADRGVELLTAMFYCKAVFEPEDPLYHSGLKYIYPADVDHPVESSKCFLEMVDSVRWKTEGARNREAFLEHRHAVEEAVLGKKDKELFYMCIEKNIFPASDMVFLSGKISEEMEDALPMMVMKRHGYL